MKTDNGFALAIFGIPEFEQKLLERIISLSESRDTVYRIVDEAQSHTADIALVDRSNANTADEIEQFFAQRQDFPTVVVANGKDSESEYWVKRPFTALRMLGALDKLVEDKLRGADRPQPNASAPKADDTAKKPAVAAGIYKALVVDDSLPVRKQVSVALRRAGITAEFAEDAESALQLIETRSYDILFLDVVLPGKDGYEICKAVKADKRKKHIPVIMLSGKSSPIDKVKGKLSGCDAYPDNMKTDNGFALAIFGIPEFEQKLLERIISLSESRDTVYRIVDEAQSHTADIALVDRSNANTADEIEQFFAQRQDFPTVVVANGKDSESEYWVKRPFTALRMLGALDKLVEDKLRGADRPQPNASAPKADDTAKKPAVAAGIYKALVVDDSLPVRKQVSVALRRAGITAEFAEDAESALQLIETRSYDILFLDVVLPGKDGYEICKAVKADKRKKHIPVIMLSGKSSPIDKVKGKLSGCDAYLTKPVSLKEFNQTLSKWLKPPLSFESMAAAT